MTPTEQQTDGIAISRLGFAEIYTIVEFFLEQFMGELQQEHPDFDWDSHEFFDHPMRDDEISQLIDSPEFRRIVIQPALDSLAYAMGCVTCVENAANIQDPDERAHTLEGLKALLNHEP